MSFIKSIFTDKDTSKGGNGDEYYDIEVEDAVTEEGSSKMILLEPRAYSEAQQIADHLKKRNSVVSSILNGISLQFSNTDMYRNEPVINIQIKKNVYLKEDR